MDIYNDMLYVSTQGSVAQPNGSVEHGLASQVIAYDLTLGQDADENGYVFVPQPTPDPMGMGFISMLGVQVYCLGQDEGADYNYYYYYHNEEYCFLYTSDFAGGLRVYKLEDGSLVFGVPTTYQDGSATGELSVYRDAIHVTGFTNEEPGHAVVQRFSALDESPLPSLQFNANDVDSAFFLPPPPPPPPPPIPPWCDPLASWP